MRSIIIISAVILLTSMNLSAVITEEQQAKLLGALVEMGKGPLSQESPVLCEYVMREDLDIEERLSLIGHFFSGNAFTEHHAFNLEAHLKFSTVEKAKIARFAGSFAAGALCFKREDPEIEAAGNTFPLLFLESVFNTGTMEIKEAVGTGINDILEKQHLNFTAVLTGGSGSDRDVLLETMQQCVTLGAYSGGRNIQSWLELPQNMAEFFNRTKIWLFDGGTLGPIHLTILESLLTVIPASLHGVVAAFVPEISGISANSSPLRAPGLFMDIPLVDIEMLRNMTIYPHGAALSPIPEFTALLLERLAGAIQTTQYALRPDLYQRIQSFFFTVTGTAIPALSAFLPAEVLQGTPEECMRYLGFLWLVNSQVLLDSALALAEQQQRAPLFLSLLAADTFSEKSDAALICRCSPSGILFGAKTALRRESLSPEIHYANGIAASGKMWQYDMSDMAGMAPAP